MYIFTSSSRIQLAALLVPALALSALVPAPGTLGAVTYAAVTTVFMALSVIVLRTYAKTSGMGTLGHFGAMPDVRMAHPPARS
jgi:hypothetical protein